MQWSKKNGYFCNFEGTPRPWWNYDMSDKHSNKKIPSCSETFYIKYLKCIGEESSFFL